MSINRKTDTPLSIFEATMIAEGCFELTGLDLDDAEPHEVEELQIEAVQRLIDTGVVWQLQGYFGRLATSLIEAGECHAAGEA